MNETKAQVYLFTDGSVNPQSDTTSIDIFICHIDFTYSSYFNIDLSPSYLKFQEF